MRVRLAGAPGLALVALVALDGTAAADPPTGYRCGRFGERNVAEQRCDCRNGYVTARDAADQAICRKVRRRPRPAPLPSPPPSSACPGQVEDPDGFQDGDGCPDPDNDGDGLLDEVDACPDGAEDPDGFRDGDGCPDADNDEDGVADAEDRCPVTAEDRDGVDDADGCPDPDSDGDGGLDAVDRCVDRPEDGDGRRGADGCPDDGVVPAVALEVSAPRGSNRRRRVGVGLGGVGVVSLGAALVIELWARSTYERAKRGEGPDPDALYDAANQRRHVAIVLGLSGAAIAGAGGYLWWSGRRAGDHRVAVTPLITSGSFGFGVAGGF